MLSTDGQKQRNILITERAKPIQWCLMNFPSREGCGQYTHVIPEKSPVKRNTTIDPWHYAPCLNMSS